MKVSNRKIQKSKGRMTSRNFIFWVSRFIFHYESDSVVQIPKIELFRFQGWQDVDVLADLDI